MILPSSQNRPGYGIDRQPPKLNVYRKSWLWITLYGFAIMKERAIGLLLNEASRG